VYPVREYILDTAQPYRSIMSGYFKIILAAIIWGSLGTVVRFIHLPTLILVFYRVSFAAIAIFVYIAMRHKTEVLAVGKRLYWIIAMGILLTINWTAFFFSIRLTSVANAVLITYTAPIFVAILAPLILKEKLEKITILSLGISLVGTALIVSASVTGLSKSALAGILWAVVSAITYAVLVIISKPLADKIDPVAIIFYEELVGAIILSPALFIYKFSISPLTLFILFVVGAFHTAFAAALYLNGLRDVKAQQVGIFTYLDPASAVVFAAIFLGEIPRPVTILGGLFIIASGLILVMVTRQRVETEVVSE